MPSSRCQEPDPLSIEQSWSSQRYLPFRIRNLTLLPLGTTTTAAAATTSWTPLLPSRSANTAASPTASFFLCSPRDQHLQSHPVADWWGSVTGLHPSPRAGTNMSSDFLTGETEEEFPREQKDNKVKRKTKTLALQDEKGSVGGGGGGDGCTR